ncbi:hypothetical protein AB0L22_08815 [Micromonospora haikouensis]|uniref:hypothetical protein n=1 Tax=Micromonospora haikouensis TaxID=686309 RepID=UPI00342296C4
MTTLTTRNAEIRTAAVEIRTLTMSGKQVTLTVFRQLPEQPLIGDDGTLHGVPWGWVNYHPEPKDCPTVDHRHIVWQHGTDLRRATVEVTYQPPSHFRPPSGVQYVNAYARDTFRDRRLPQVGWDGDSMELVERGIRLLLPISSAARDAADMYGLLRKTLLVLKEQGPNARTFVRVNPQARGAGRLVYGTALEAEACQRRQLDDMLLNLGVDSLEDTFEVVLREVDAEVQRRARHQDARRALADLPQLFIAV